MKLVPFHNCRRFALVDDDQFNWVNQWNWYYIRTSKTARTEGGYAKTKNGKVMHRELMLRWGRLKPGLVVDHRNACTTDNRYANLHAVTEYENRQKRCLYKTSGSGVRGVAQIGDKWTASIWFPSGVSYIKGKSVHLGTFLTFDEAKQARLDAEREHGMTHFAELDAARDKLEQELLELVAQGQLEMTDDPSLPLEARFLYPCSIAA